MKVDFHVLNLGAGVQSIIQESTLNIEGAGSLVP